MSAVNSHTVSGRISEKPELQYTPNGVPAATFSLARQPRRFNKQTNQWEDGELLWYRVRTYKRLAENASASLDKGVEVTVTGEVKLVTYKNRQGEEKSQLEIVAEDITVSLDHQILTVTDRSAYGNQVGGGTPSSGGTAPNNSYQGAADSSYQDDTPF